MEAVNAVGSVAVALVVVVIVVVVGVAVVVVLVVAGGGVGGVVVVGEVTVAVEARAVTVAVVGEAVVAVVVVALGTFFRFSPERFRSNSAPSSALRLGQKAVALRTSSSSSATPKRAGESGLALSRPYFLRICFRACAGTEQPWLKLHLSQ